MNDYLEAVAGRAVSADIPFLRPRLRSRFEGPLDGRRGRSETAQDVEPLPALWGEEAVERVAPVVAYRERKTRMPGRTQPETRVASDASKSMAPADVAAIAFTQAETAPPPRAARAYTESERIEKIAAAPQWDERPRRAEIAQVAERRSTDDREPLQTRRTTLSEDRAPTAEPQAARRETQRIDATAAIATVDKLRPLETRTEASQPIRFQRSIDPPSFEQPAVQERTIHITIGRVDVKAVVVPNASKQPDHNVARPLPLDEYLKRRDTRT